MKFVITGAGGQLGKAFIISLKENNQDFVAFSSKELDITNNNAVLNLFSKHHFDCIINTAAFTNVDKAETDKDLALNVNAKSLDLISSLCKKYNKKLIHFSTDYVFSGEDAYPYMPSSETNPINYYGETKLLGERIILSYDFDCLIIRTSWVFSFHSKNFLTNILNLGKNQSSISIVNDQYGCPTFAKDISDAVIKICLSKRKPKDRLYHLAGSPSTSWFQFAKKIISSAQESSLIDKNLIVNEISSDAYISIAKRPNNSVLDSSIILNEFSINELNWEKVVLNEMQNITLESIY